MLDTVSCSLIRPQNIDTDQIIPAEYLTLVPSKPDEYEKLGSFAMIGLPDEEYPIKFVEEGQMKTKYPIIIAGDNFGCGSSREHAPVSIGASGTQAVVAETYARIFFRNCISTGELYPVETPQRICDQITTGEEVELDIVSVLAGLCSMGEASREARRSALSSHVSRTHFLCSTGVHVSLCSLTGQQHVDGHQDGQGVQPERPGRRGPRGGRRRYLRVRAQVGDDQEDGDAVELKWAVMIMT